MDRPVVYNLTYGGKIVVLLAQDYIEITINGSLDDSVSHINVMITVKMKK